ncbi:Hypothetical protein NTJ_14127 [Nesidiocoris tenuis]|uniref:Uncharacterized protein n=1 Tax=Nesidiocoris tenuis TaxID=355587 RepID=A0ABN7BDP8_9HEMI|nr:Hypothetical protein NTJ_14127 [Nesidiocoris tenuis]
MAAAELGSMAIRRVATVLGEIAASGSRSAAQELPPLVTSATDGLLVAPPIVWAGPDECKKEEKQAKKLGPVCRAPDLRRKPVPPYVYGYCKEPEPELPMSCPPKSTKKRKGPCCLNESKQKGGSGCSNK